MISRFTKRFRRPFAIFLLAGLVCLIVAYLWSRAGETRVVELMPGESVEVSPGTTLELKGFAIPRYPGGKPRQFESEIELHDSPGSSERKLSINHPLIRRDFWIYQTEDFDPVTERETTLAVVGDPSLPLAALGALLLLVGACSLLPPVLRVTHAQAWTGSLDGRAREVTSTTGRVLLAVAVTVIPLFVVARVVFRAEPPPSLQSWLLAPHVGAYVASYILLLFAASGIGKRFMALGFLLMTLGMALGGVWGKLCWMHWWQNDPKEVASLATWIVYFAYFLFRDHPRSERLWRWLGAAMILFSVTVVNFTRLFAGLHSY